MHRANGAANALLVAWKLVFASLFFDAQL